MTLPQVPNYFGMVARYGQQPQNPLQEALGVQALQRGQAGLQRAQQQAQQQQQFQQALQGQLASGQPLNLQGFTGGITPTQAQELGTLSKIGQPAQQPPEPSDVREFRFAQSQGYRGSFTDFLQSKRAQGATVNLPPQEKAEDVTIGKGLGAEYTDIRKQGQNAAEALPTLQRLQRLSQQFRGGIGAEYQKRYGAALAQLGFPSKGTKSIQEYDTDLAQYLIDRQKELGGSFRMTDTARESIRQSKAGSELVPEARAELLKEAIRATNVLIERRKLAADYRRQTGKYDEGFDDYYQRHSQFAGGGAALPPDLPLGTTANPDGTFTMADGTIIRKKAQ